MRNRFRKYFYSNNKLFYKSLFRLAIPMGITALLNSLLNMSDTLMISTISKEAVAGVGSANKLFFLMTVTLYGVFSGFGVFVSQYHGKKDHKRLQTAYMTALINGIIISSITSILAIIYPRQVIELFSDDPLVINLGIDYLRIVGMSYILSSIIFSIEMVSRSTENVKLPMRVSFLGIILNIVLNSILIFGLLGFEPLGVKGAAIATLTTRSIQFIIYLIYIIITKDSVLYLKFSNFVFDLKMFTKMYLRSLPVVGNEFLWALGTIALFAAYGRKGTDALASIQLFDTFVGLLTVFTWGVANSSSIMIGKKLGENNLEVAKSYAKLFLFASLVFGTFTGIVISLSTPLVPFLFYEQEINVLRNIQNLLLIFSLYAPVKLLAATFIVGILRSGGDTIFALIVEGGALWGFAVPMAFILVNFTTLSLPLIYLIISLEEVIKVITCYNRYKFGNYIHNLVH